MTEFFYFDLFQAIIIVYHSFEFHLVIFNNNIIFSLSSALWKVYFSVFIKFISFLKYFFSF